MWSMATVVLHTLATCSISTVVKRRQVDYGYNSLNKILYINLIASVPPITRASMDSNMECLPYLGCLLHFLFLHLKTLHH